MSGPAAVACGGDKSEEGPGRRGGGGTRAARESEYPAAAGRKRKTLRVTPAGTEQSRGHVESGGHTQGAGASNTMSWEGRRACPRGVANAPSRGRSAAVCCALGVPPPGWCGGRGASRAQVKSAEDEEGGGGHPPPARTAAVG